MRMKDYIIRRLILLIPVLLGVSMISFALMEALPGDPAYAWVGERGTDEQIEQARETYHLNDPLHVRYFAYMKSLITGDLGYSHSQHRPVADCIKDFFPATFELTVISIILCALMGIPLGVISAVKKDKPIDHITRIVALTGVSMPIFWLGLLLILVFYFYLGWLPGGGRYDSLLGPPAKVTGLNTVDAILAGDFTRFKDAIRHLILPAFALSYHSMGIILRMTRSSMLDVMQQDYIRTARAKGLSERKVVYKHTLRNALIPTTTVIGLAFGGLLGGAILTETIFSWPGMGRFMFNSISGRDYPAIMGCTILISIIYIIANLIVDLSYAFLDPRIRLGGSH